jgi:hypothetical protein
MVPDSYLFRMGFFSAQMKTGALAFYVTTEPNTYF